MITHDTEDLTRFAPLVCAAAEDDGLLGVLYDFMDEYLAAPALVEFLRSTTESVAPRDGEDRGTGYWSAFATSFAYWLATDHVFIGVTTPADRTYGVTVEVYSTAGQHYDWASVIRRRPWSSEEIDPLAEAAIRELLGKGGVRVEANH